MSLGLTRAEVRAFWRLSLEEQRRLIEGMTPEQQLRFDAEFEVWAQEGQLMPDGEGWRVWLMLAGRGFGKTRAGAEWVHTLGCTRGKRIALVAASIDEARSIMVEGASGLLSVARSRKVNLRWEPSLKKLTWPSGSIAELYSGDSADALRGPEHHFAWCASADRHRAGGGGRERRYQRAAGQSGGRAMLHRRDGADRGMGGPGQGNCRFCGGRLAVRRGDCGDARAGQGERPDRDL